MRIHQHAIVTVVATLLLMLMGSLVHGTGSSLACPDWPLCHGSFFPAMIHGVQFEHTHRLMAAGVVLLTTSLLVRTFRPEGKPARGLVAAACGLVVVQALLGGLTVIYRLPPAISIAHLATSMAFLSVLVMTAARLAPRSGGSIPGKRGWLGVATGLVYVQIVLGAVVRHTGAVLACTGVPLCNGDLWPEAGLSRLHMAHRAVAVLALIVTLVASSRAFRRAGTRGARVVALAPILAAVVQVSLGIAMVLAYAPLDLVTLHHLGGALLLGSLVLCWSVSYSFGGEVSGASGDDVQDSPAGGEVPRPRGRLAIRA
jgi:heme A synthase